MNRSGGHGKGQIPNRWLHCPRKALDLINGKLIAFKVPLDGSFDDQVPPAGRFPPKMLFELCKSKKVGTPDVVRFSSRALDPNATDFRSRSACGST